MQLYCDSSSLRLSEPNPNPNSLRIEWCSAHGVCSSKIPSFGVFVWSKCSRLACSSARQSRSSNNNNQNPETRDAQTIDVHTYDTKILCTVHFPLRHPNFFFSLCILSVDEEFFFCLLFSSQIGFVFADYRKVTIHNNSIFFAIVTVNVVPSFFSARFFLLHRLLEVWSAFNIQQCLIGRHTKLIHFQNEVFLPQYSRSVCVPAKRIAHSQMTSFFLNFNVP